MSFVWSNFFSTTLAAAVATGDTTINVASAANAPTITAGQQWAIIVQSASTPSSREVMYVTAISSDAFTVTRAQEGTAAGTWAVGDEVIGGNTDGVMSALGQLAATQTWSGTNTFDNAVTAPSFNPAGSAGYFGYTSGNTILVLGSSTYIQGASAGGSIVLVADGQVNTFATDGDITAARRHRSTSGAAGSGDGNACTILNDFPSTLGTTGIKKYPDPNSPTGYFIEQWFTATSASGTNTYNFPVAFPNAALSIVISPGVPCSNVQAAAALSASQYQVQNNYSGNITSYVVAKGY